MQEISVLFADDLSVVSKRFCEYLNLGFKIKTCAKNGEAVLDELRRNNYDVIVMDVFLQTIDALGVLLRLKDMNPKRKPAIIIESSMNNPSIENEFIRNGANAYLIKPVSPNVLISKIKAIAENRYKNALMFTNTKPDNEVMVTDILNNMAVSIKMKGYRYLRYAIVSAIENPELLNGITTELYPYVANRYAASATCVERDIRTAINSAWKNGDIIAFSRYFGYNRTTRNKAPTNAEFIARIVDEILLKYKIQYA